MTLFLSSQPAEQVQDYIQTLASVGALSKLFSENKAPYLYYRAAENIFCKAFQAENQSRSDAAIDATKGSIGIGLKTFLYRNSQYEKIAEFNKENSFYKNLEKEDLIRYIAERRNDRIESSIRVYGLTETVYHCVARTANKFIVYEVPMALIDLPNIRNVEQSDNGNTVSFTDGNSEYRFNRTKSTLYKKFVVPDDVREFNVDILENPYQSLTSHELPAPDVIESISVEPEDNTNYVILPLYSPATKTQPAYVAEKSGINAWNAGGRTRDENEIYLKVPLWIHDVYPDFFPEQDSVFNLKLPDGKTTFSAKIVQQGRKALTTNPNKDLGEWLLRTVMEVPEGEILTYDKLKELDIDSVAIYKQDDDNFSIEVKKFGSYEDFVAKTAATS